MQEVEKKYYTQSELPFPLYNFDSVYLEQKYIALTENEELRVRRVVSASEKWWISYKKGKGDIREEREIEVSSKIGVQLWNNATHEFLAKSRYYIPYKDKTIELDIFMNGPIRPVAEIEFNSAEEMSNFEFPDWFEEECKLSNRDFIGKIYND